MVRLYMCRRCIFACPFQHRYWDKRNFIFRFFAAIFSLACFTLTTEETLWNEYPNVTLFIITPRSIIAEIVTSEMQSTNFPSLHTIELCNAILIFIITVQVIAKKKYSLQLITINSHISITYSTTNITEKAVNESKTLLCSFPIIQLLKETHWTYKHGSQSFLNW